MWTFLLPLTQQPEINVPDEIDVPVNVLGAEQNEQRIEQLKNSLDGIANMQNAINSVGSSLYILPEDSKREIVDVNKEITRMRQALNYIQENPFMLDTSITTLQIQAMSDSLDDLMQRQRQLDESLGNVPSQVVHIEYENETPELNVPENIRIPIEWQSDNLEVFTGTGVERFQQEVQSANNMLNTLNTTQERIAATAAQTDLFPANAVSDMNNMQNRLTAISQRIQAIENNPLNLGSDEANAELEQLREQLDQAVQQQEALNRAVENMDVEAANQAYLRLSQTVRNTERYIRDNTDGQGRFNRAIESGTEQASKLIDIIKGAVAAYVSVQTVEKALDLSDQLTSTTARLNLMNDGLQTTQDLQNMIYLSAERSRGAYQQTADAVSKLGLMAGDAFSSSEEIIAFTEQLNKQFTIAGTEAAGIDAAMLQLTQAMGSGVLRGEEYNSVLEQAPNIIQAIADYLDVPKGQLKDMAAEGQITAEIVKNAMFAAADETNAKFESMPKTFSQIWTSFQNTALMAFQPVLQRLNEIANSEAFQAFVENAVTALSIVAGIALEIFDLMVQVGTVIADNWSWISPIVYGVAGALAVYYGWLLLVKGAEIAMAAATGIATLAKMLAVPVYAALTGATMADTAAQWGLNTALYACPIVWIIILIIALIALFYAIIAAVNHFAGTCISATGIICGLFMGILAVVGNVLVAAWNLIVDVFVLIYNLVADVANFIGNVFTDPIGAICRLFFGLADTVLGILQALASAIDAIFGSNLSGSVQGWRDSLSGWVDDTFGKGTEVMAKMNADDMKLGRFDYTEAVSVGYNFGEGIEEGISNFDPSSLFDINIPSADDYSSGMNLSGIGSGVDDIAGNTGAIADSMDITEEDLKYLRDIAEQEAVNRFTTAEITIEQTNNNNISSNMDLDGIVSGLTDAVNEAVDSITEGVHN